MKKIYSLLLVLTLCTAAQAQTSDSKWTLNTRAWTTNYWTLLAFDGARAIVHELLFDDSSDSVTFRRIVPAADLVFPIGLQKDGPGTDDIRSPYNRAFANPIKHIGDYGIGLETSYQPGVLGFYAGAFFKSVEMVSKSEPVNLRGFYFQPTAGVQFAMGSKRDRLFGVNLFYDVVTGCAGDDFGLGNADKDMIKGGLGLGFVIGSKKGALEFTMPLHNFFNEDYKDAAGNTPLKGVKRKVGYIMLHSRIDL